jgi:hypothetical protein
MKFKSLVAGLILLTSVVGASAFWHGSSNGQSAQVIVYGTTPGGVSAAYQAALEGQSVILVGGWNETEVGGLSGPGNLGSADTANKSTIGGLARLFFQQTNTLMGRVDDGTNLTFSTTFEPRFATQVFNTWLSSTNVPVVFTTGVSSVDTVGTAGVDLRITALHTVDGKTFTGQAFIDASYEGDLMATAGVPFTVGREAANANNASNGFRGTLTSKAEFATGTGTLVNVDPWIIPGDITSGLLPGIITKPVLANGSADSRVQSYNFRLLGNNTANGGRRVTMFPGGVPPANYNAANYELLLRYLKAVTDAGGTLALGQLVAAGGVGNNVLDVNNGPDVGFSTDFVGMADSYPTASYSQRATIIQAHIDYDKGFWYTLQYSTDPRMIPSLQTSALNWGYDTLNPPFRQIYVREARRMVSDFIMNAIDMNQTTGSTPRSVKIIAAGDYPQDSHHVERFADNSTGTWRAWNEGNLAGGVNTQGYPIPYEITQTPASGLTNLFVINTPSCTKVAWTSLRIEHDLMSIGQAVGMAAAIKNETGSTAQNVDYATLRARLLATTTPVPPYMPLLNFVLERDLDPTSNDNSPMWLEKAA